MPAKVILLVDDETNIREIVQACLKDLAGWEVISVASVREGLYRVLTEQPDAIVLDVHVPRIDTFAFLRELRANSATHGIPTVLLSETHYLSPQQIQQFGIAGVIAKPFNSVTLPRQIATILGWDTKSFLLSG